MGLCTGSYAILEAPQFGLDHQEVDVHLRQGLGQLLALAGSQHVLQDCRGDPAEDGDVAHDVEAPRRLDVGDGHAGLLLIPEPPPEVLLLLWVREPSHLCHHVNALRRDLIGCGRPRGYPETSGRKQLPPDEVCQQHVHRGGLCDISQDLGVGEIQRQPTLVQSVEDEHDLESVEAEDSGLFSLTEEPVNEFHQAVPLTFQQIQLSEGEGKHELNVLIGFAFRPVQSELLRQDGFPDTGDSLGHHRAARLSFSRQRLEDLLTSDRGLGSRAFPGGHFDLSDLVLVVDLSAPSLCDEELGVDLVQKGRLLRFIVPLKQALVLLL